MTLVERIRLFIKSIKDIGSKNYKKKLNCIYFNEAFVVHNILFYLKKKLLDFEIWYYYSLIERVDFIQKWKIYRKKVYISL